MSRVNASSLSLWQEPLIDLIYFDAGGGHRTSAIALQAVAEGQGRPWRIRLINLRDVLEPADFIHRVTGIRAEDLYNGMLKFGLTAGVGAMLPVMHLLIRATHRRNVGLLADHWTRSRPNLVVSLIPHFNRTIFEGLRTADARLDRRTTPMVTIMTDFADYPPHFWIEAQDQFLICATESAVRQAGELGVDSRRVLRTSGMIVRPEFYTRPKFCRAEGRRRLGLDPELPTGLVMFGGYGSRQMLAIAQRLADSRQRLQLIFMCGHNLRLRQQLSAMDLPFPSHIEGFTNDVPCFMGLADFFVGKPGPGTISEALVSGLPVIVARNASTMAQERYNTEWIRENQVGIVIRSLSEIDKAVERITEEGQLARFRSQVEMLDNRAVFEIPEILDEVMATGCPSSPLPQFKHLSDPANLYE
jgi:1,2-diacylglycerol 3-beta-galactosyltransferase